jgi:hypothetical protein
MASGLLSDKQPEIHCSRNKMNALFIQLSDYNCLHMDNQLAASTVLHNGVATIDH